MPKRDGAGAGNVTADDLDALTDTVARLRRALRRGVRLDVPSETLSGAQVELLQLLDESPGLRASAVGDRLLLAPTTVSTLVGQLLAADLIDRRADPADRRAWRLHLTSAGRQQLKGWRQANRVALRSGLDRLSDQERAALHAALPALARLAEQLDAEGEMP